LSGAGCEVPLSPSPLPQGEREPEHPSPLVGEGARTPLSPCGRGAGGEGANHRLVVLVPGQVEDDASVRYGCIDVKTNLGLLQAVRLARPDAFIVYKPHPDVVSGNRAGALAQAREFADHVETHCSVVSCIEACDEVHTMTSLAGFDALLRGKRVVTYGQPFYAGWGLTQDIVTDGAAFTRRIRRLTLDALVAGALLRYPIYWNWDLKRHTTCEAVLHRIVETRNALEKKRRPGKTAFRPAQAPLAQVEHAGARTVQQGVTRSAC
jgi:capsule polysaccharide export protein KpsC/LpsZ